jgi:hypothetical protein
MTTKLVKATFVFEFPEDLNGDFLLAHVADILEPGEKVLGFWVHDTDNEQLEQEGFGDFFTDD